VHNNNISTVVLYSLNTGTNIRTQSVNFPLDGIVKVGDNWVAICTTEEEGNSSVKVQNLFGDSENSVEQVPIERWFRVWNDCMPILTMDHREETEKQEIARI